MSNRIPGISLTVAISDLCVTACNNNEKHPGKAATRPAGPMPKKGAYLQENGEEAPVAPEAEAKGDESGESGESDDSDDSDADADDVDTAAA